MFDCGILDFKSLVVNFYFERHINALCAKTNGPSENRMVDLAETPAISFLIDHFHVSIVECVMAYWAWEWYKRTVDEMTVCWREYRRSNKQQHYPFGPHLQFLKLMAVHWRENVFAILHLTSYSLISITLLCVNWKMLLTLTKTIVTLKKSQFHRMSREQKKFVPSPKQVWGEMSLIYGVLFGCGRNLFCFFPFLLCP